MDDESEVVARAADTLYAAPPEDFMSTRTELAKAAKQSGDAAAAKAIAALRKPTAAAAVVNRFVHAQPSAVDRLTALGDRLRRAHHDLDASAMRELTGERRTTVAEVVQDAFTQVGESYPTTALRDEVTATLDAAVADPDVASRLGRLLRAEHFSGFGVAAGTPELTLVRGGRGTRRMTGTPTRPTRPTRQTGGISGTADERPADTSPAKPAGARADTSTTRAVTRRREKAQADFDAADSRFTTAETTQQRENERVHTLTAEIAERQRALDEAKRALDAARREVRAARSQRRDARAALDRADRAADRVAERTTD